jgi:hypothetical protein
MPNNKDQNRKHAPLTMKIKRLFTGKKGIDPHTLYQEEYYCKLWFNHADTNGIEAVARIKKVTEKGAAHIMAEVAFHHIMGELDAKDMDEMDAAQLAERPGCILKCAS